MGDIENWMKEKHIIALYNTLSNLLLTSDIPVDNVNIIRDKVTGNKQIKEGNFRLLLYFLSLRRIHMLVMCLKTLMGNKCQTLRSK
jgi:hypothetical protein